MSFATLESCVNTSVLRHLSNASGTCNGVTVQGIFKREYVESLAGAGMSGVMPTFKIASSLVPANPRGKVFSINAVDYRVTEIEPDSTGLTKLILELV